MSRTLGLFCLIAIVGFSAYTAYRQDPLKGPPKVEAAKPAKPVVETAQNEEDDDDVPVNPRNNRPPSAGQQIMLDNGATVTKFTPGMTPPPSGGGPAIINVGPKIGQDPKMAAFPNDALLEDTPNGRLPIMGGDGMRPMDQYARPWSGARGTRIAIVVSGLGLSQTGTQRAIRELPEEITLAFAVSGNSLQRWMPEARRAGHEILLQMPFEPFDYPANDPGPLTLLTSKTKSQNLASLHQSMGKITNYTGIMNYLGGRFLAEPKAMEPILRDIGKRGLLFLDDGASAQSQTETLARTLNVPHAFADMQIDTQLDRDAILKKLDDLERIAKRNGTAIGVGSAFDETVDAVAKWSEEAASRGIEIVGVASLANDPSR